MGDNLLIADIESKLRLMSQAQQNLVNNKKKKRRKLSNLDPTQYLDGWQLTNNKYCK